jgi:hypothetical protein
MTRNALRFAAAAILALAVVCALLYAALFITSRIPEEAGPPAERTEPEKLELLESLRASSTPSADERRETLHAMDRGASVPEERKLNVLEGLKQK